MLEQICPAVHSVVQLPQWLLSLVRSTQIPLQLVKPVLQETPHTPLAQVALPLGAAGQSVGLTH